MTQRIEATHIGSRDNALVKELKRLSQDSTAYRRLSKYWVEGEHLCSAALTRGMQPAVAVFSETFWPLALVEYKKCALKNVVISDAAFAAISSLESSAHFGFVMDLTAPPALQTQVASVILDRVQDAGNVGSILRSASAFGFKQVLALKGTAALFSPKVLRAGMGAHWGLSLLEGLSLQDLASYAAPIVVTSSHAGVYLHQMQRSRALPMPCAWAMGHEGQGVCAELDARATLHVRIAQPGGEESLNVAAAAAICLQASSAGVLG